LATLLGYGAVAASGTAAVLNVLEGRLGNAAVDAASAGYGKVGIDAARHLPNAVGFAHNIVGEVTGRALTSMCKDR
jgi:hypothetical protein